MKIKFNGIFSISVFIIMVLKFVFINIFEFINSNSSTHRIISSFFIIPLLFAGTYYSVDALLDSYSERRKIRLVLMDLNVIVSLPTLLLFLFLLGQIIMSFSTIPRN